jgi:hypothetical protein
MLLRIVYGLNLTLGLMRKNYGFQFRRGFLSVIMALTIIASVNSNKIDGDRLNDKNLD